MSVSIRLDTSQFNAAMREYLEATKKDSAHAINRQMLNFSIKGRTLTRLAEKGDIASMESQPFWPKIVAKVIGNAAGSLASSKAFQSQWAAAQVSQHRKGAFKLDREESSYVKLAKQVSKSLLKKRLRGIGFMRFFFLSIAQAISAKASVGKQLSGKKFTGFVAVVRPATENKLSCEASATYPYERRTANTAKRAERLLQQACDMALPLTIADMKKYASDQMAKRASQFSGRAA